MFHSSIEYKNKDLDKRITISVHKASNSLSHSLHSIEYTLIFPSVNNKEGKEEEFNNSLANWVLVQITHWFNTAGKGCTFDKLVKQFEKYCKDAEKLKIG